MNVCTTCGFRGYLEKHHVGGRKYSDLITSLCKPCHDYCTVTDVYERIWPKNTPSIPRIWAGVMDMWSRFGYCYGLNLTSDALDDAEYQQIWDYKACSQIAVAPTYISISTITHQLSELGRLTREVINYAIKA